MLTSVWEQATTQQTTPPSGKATAIYFNKSSKLYTNTVHDFPFLMERTNWFSRERKREADLRGVGLLAAPEVLAALISGEVLF